jgi:hypothetical protein
MVPLVFFSCYLSTDEAADLDSKGATELVKGTLHVVRNTASGVTLAGALGFSLGPLYGFNSVNLSQQAIDQIAELLDQRQLEDFQWRTRSISGQLSDAENLYERYECIEAEKVCDDNLLDLMSQNALNLHSQASQVFNDILEARHLGYEQMQLVPDLIHAGGLMYTAIHEMSLVELASGASQQDIERREASMRSVALRTLDALDEMEDLFYQHVNEAVVNGFHGPENGSLTRDRYVWGCFKSPYGTNGLLCASLNYTPHLSDDDPRSRAFQGAKLMRILALERDRHAARYIKEHQHEVFGEAYAEFRAEMLKRAGSDYSSDLFQWSFVGRPEGGYTRPAPAQKGDERRTGSPWACTQITEKADPHAWHNNWFCARRDFGIRWSQHGGIEGFRCTQVHEPADPHAWQDNYICVPQTSDLKFLWAFATSKRDEYEKEGYTCVQWIEPSDPHGWHDNYLCYSDVSRGG